ncbi:hypothetical protein NPX13_g2004 [Xylaria arbuscula]|uniref:Uncharacterized protein n=1 Tax=Xylaria arbuscula TaxID=114810 RepID=A0A9W8TQS9_9PEZI|nr:hypothetical protein NPX13_g2004 [Xylaria arbuscula]
MVQLLLNRNADTNARDGFGHTPLDAAAMVGNNEAVKLLLNKGVDINGPAKNIVTALYLAATHNHTAIVEMLLARGGFIDTTDTDFIPLHEAVMNSHRKAVELLFDLGPKADVIVKNGFTPLHESAAKGLGEAVIRFLLNQGAPVNAPNNEGSTLLHIAASGGFDIGVSQLLLEYGAEANLADDNGRTPLHIAAEMANKAALGTHDDILHACSLTPGFYRAVMRLLLDHGAKINVADVNGRTPLHVAVEGAAFKTHDGEQEDNHATPWQKVASESLNKEIIQLLLDYGAQTDTTDNDGRTPLHLAVERANKAAFELLLYQEA